MDTTKKVKVECYLKMDTIFMNTLNSKTNESNKFIYQFTDKLNLKNPNKNIALANLSIYYTMLQFEMINLIYLMDLILFLISKIILNLSSKNMKLL